MLLEHLLLTPTHKSWRKSCLAAVATVQTHQDFFCLFVKNVSAARRCQRESPGDWSLLFIHRINTAQITVLQATPTLHHSCAFAWTQRLESSSISIHTQALSCLLQFSLRLVELVVQGHRPLSTGKCTETQFAKIIADLSPIKPTEVN